MPEIRILRTYRYFHPQDDRTDRIQKQTSNRKGALQQQQPPTYLPTYMPTYLQPTPQNPPSKQSNLHQDSALRSHYNNAVLTGTDVQNNASEQRLPNKNDPAEQNTKQK